MRLSHVDALRTLRKFAGRFAVEVTCRVFGARPVTRIVDPLLTKLDRVGVLEALRAGR